MTIKEVEARAKLGRANIRYYEQEGLLSPQRAPNGYREYSEADVVALQRIMLLRRLGFTLEEIKALQRGERALGEALGLRLAALEREKRQAGEAQAVCRAIRAEGATYGTLNPAKYLEAAPHAAEALAADTAPLVNYPWRRYFARALDLSLCMLLWDIALSLGFRVNILARAGALGLADTIVACVLMLLLEPLLLRYFGTTPGKWIFGLYLEREDGARPSYEQGLERAWGAFGRGYGYVIPIFCLVRLYQSYSRCRADSPQPWDEGWRYTIRDTNWYRGVAYVAAVAAFLGATWMAALLGRLPPNRGDLTIAEFAENYNALMRYYGLERGKRLNAAGQWEEIPQSATAIVSYFPAEEPAFQYTLRDGALTAVGFAIEQDGGDAWMVDSRPYMQLAALAFAGAQREMGPFSGFRDDIVRLIDENARKGFQIEEAGVALRCTVETEGYLAAALDAGVFMPIDENGEDAYFSLSFSMEKPPA